MANQTQNKKNVSHKSTGRAKRKSSWRDVATLVVLTLIFIGLTVLILYNIGVIGTGTPQSVVTPPSDDPTPIMYVEPEHLIF
jgi:hypothetical protein